MIYKLFLFSNNLVMYLSVLKIILIVLLVVSGKIIAEEKRVICSDLLQDPLSRYLEKQLTDSSKWNIQFKGSYIGLQMLESNEADMGILALKSDQRKDLEVNPNYLVLSFAFQTFFIGVNTANDIREIKVDVLKDIFSKDGMDQFSGWGDINSNFQDNILSDIYVLLASERIGIGNQLFKAEVLEGENYNIKATVVESHQELSIIVSSNPNSLALFTKKPRSEKIRILSITPSKSNYAFSPSRQNLFYSDYPYYLSFMVVCRKGKVKNFKELCQILYSNDFFEEIETEGFIGLPIIEQKKILSSYFGL